MIAANHDRWTHMETCSLAFFLTALSDAAQAAVAAPEAGIQTTQTLSKTDIGACTLTEVLAPVSSIAWPLLALLIVLLTAFNSRVGRLFGLLPRFVHKIRGPAGIEIEINADAAKEVRANFKASYEEFVRLAKDEYDRMANARGIRDLLRNVVRNALPEVLKRFELNDESDNVRATIHVDDIVF